MTDPTASEQLGLIYGLMARYLANPDTDLITPIQAHVNTAFDPALELVVLTAASITNAAQTVLAIAGNDSVEARARIAFAQMANAVDDVFIEPGTEQP